MSDDITNDPKPLLGPHPEEPTVPDFYANYVSANVTPFELNINLGRAGIPVNGPEGRKFGLSDHVRFLARVAVPLAGLPLVVKLLQEKLEEAYENKYLARESNTVEPLTKVRK